MEPLEGEWPAFSDGEMVHDQFSCVRLLVQRANEILISMHNGDAVLVHTEGNTVGIRLRSHLRVKGQLSDIERDAQGLWKSVLASYPALFDRRAREAVEKRLECDTTSLAETHFASTMRSLRER